MRPADEDNDHLKHALIVSFPHQRSNDHASGSDIGEGQRRARAVTDRPTAAWTAQTAARSAFPLDRAPRYLVRDRDHAFDGLSVTATAMGIRERLTAPRSPWHNDARYFETRTRVVPSTEANASHASSKTRRRPGVRRDAVIGRHRTLDALIVANNPSNPSLIQTRRPSPDPLARLGVVAQHARPSSDAKHPHGVLPLLAVQV